MNLHTELQRVPAGQCCDTEDMFRKDWPFKFRGEEANKKCRNPRHWI